MHSPSRNRFTNTLNRQLIVFVPQASAVDIRVAAGVCPVKETVHELVRRPVLAKVLNEKYRAVSIVDLTVSRLPGECFTHTYDDAHIFPAITLAPRAKCALGWPNPLRAVYTHTRSCCRRYS